MNGRFFFIMKSTLNSYSRRIPVKLANNPYEVVIGGSGLLGISQELSKAGYTKGIKILIVSNEDVAKHYGESLVKCLEEAGYKTTLLIIKAGENHKNPKTIGLIHDAAYKAKLERGSLMIALGGGVVGDMTGFAASTWLRGIAVVQVPTTLLAMVDAAIGGKTGVNHFGGKNLIGAFHQPKLVLIDPKTLLTLPDREFRAGMSEVIKYGVIGDKTLFNLLEETPCISKISEISNNLLEQILEKSVSAKAKVVELDESESGLRAILNYGHTFGHVIEKLCGYGNWLHGEAVSMGMVAVGQLALELGSWGKESQIRQRNLISKTSLPTKWPELDSESVIKALEGDKKVINEAIRFIIPTEIGHVEIRDDITKKKIRSFLEILN